ncbi:hypothetical protein JYU34_003006 [Plutella xylostella]|uniref:Uncharacterized protein n=1 Tax=Plutella xylostella TaxID=51655 RepID=A0ABQ7R3P2_PLUXY|nr:hypothetical protein JYU34_003006 [Plutella xylostella]
MSSLSHSLRGRRVYKVPPPPPPPPPPVVNMETRAVTEPAAGTCPELFMPGCRAAAAAAAHR